MKIISGLSFRKSPYRTTKKSYLSKIFYLVCILPIFLPAQDINKIIIDEKSGKQMAVGLCDRTVFADTNFAWWYDSEYNNYEVNVDDIDTIKNKLDGITIKIISGTWCSDSRIHVPDFLKILDELKFDEKNLTIICVDRNKKAEGAEVESFNIELVPTFIFYRNEKEIGRIVETPQTTPEGDLKDILKN